MTLWSAAAATTLGRDHAVTRKNRQDAAVAVAAGETTFGVVSDGCGEARSSEVGALLTVAFAREGAARALSRGASLETVARSAVASVVRGLAQVALAIDPREREAFVREHLLATVLGFAARGCDAVLFAAGDGLLLSSDICRVIDQHNRPSYPAYALSGHSVPVVIEHVHDVELLAVSTDGLEMAELRQVSAGSLASVGRRLVLLQRQGALADDGAVAIARREPPCAS